MDQEIDDIFAEYEDYGTVEVVRLVNTEESSMHLMTTPLMDSECVRISSLSEVFLEWYLFDSNTTKSVATFLKNEGITDVFTEKQFMDVLCGDACLDDTLVEFVALKLPFPLTLDRLHYLNSREKKRHVIVIKSKFDLIDTIKELAAQQKQQAIEKEKEIQKKYREEHHDQIIEYDRKRYKIRREKVLAQKKIYYATNKEQIAEKGKIYRETHKEEIRERKKQYGITHKEEIAEHRKKYRENNKEKLREKSKKWALEHPEYYKIRAQKPQRKKYMKEYHKKYAEENREAVQKQKKAWYEANKEKIAEQQREKHQQRKQQMEVAKKVCAAYVFLLNLRRTKKADFLQLYTAQANPLIGMIKTCPALQNMDINLCPFCNPNSEARIEQCCNQKALSLPNAMAEIQIIANELKQR